MGHGDVQLVTRAADFAAHAHREQRRKDAGQTPYINHLTEVSRLLASADCDAAVVAAGYLHDTIEDTAVTYEILLEEFGADIADLVLAVTDDKRQRKAQRKQLQIEHAAHANPRVAALKLADKISNLRSLRDTPPAEWGHERIQEYVLWAHAVVTNLPAPNPILLSYYEQVRQLHLH
jgi:(p)ppGpp synthase/HD superfamily hydrolase